MSTQEDNSSEKLSKILNSQLLIYPGNFTDAAQGVNNLGSNVRFKGEFAEKLLLYDRVIIPTFDFSIMPVLLAWLDSEALEDLLNKDAISFIRHRGFLGYFGGRGPDVFRIEKRDQSIPPRASWIKAAFADTGAAIDAWIHNASIELQPKQKQHIIDKALNCTHTIQFESEDVKRILREETYKDILESSLSRYFTPGVQLDDLPNLDQNQIRITNLYSSEQHDEIDFLLKLAFTNFEMYLAHAAGEADLTSSLDIDLLLRAKVERFLRKMHKPARVSEGFSNILDVNRLPDIAVAVAAGELGFDEISKIRSGKHGKDFRKWLHEHVADNPTEARKEYVAAISRRNLTDRLPVKTIRFLLTFAGSIPGLGLVLGPAASFADSFILDKLLRGYSPKFFIDELRAKLPSDTQR